MNLKNFVALDIETSLHHLRGTICEIGLCIVKDGKIVDEKGWLIKPPENEYSPINICIHGITPSMTEDKPTLPEVWPEIEKYLNDNLVVAHNTAFDMYALADSLSYYNISFPNFKYVCSMRTLRKALPGQYSYALDFIISALGLEMDQHHRAVSDAKACAQIFLCAINKLNVEDTDSLFTILNSRIGEFNGETHIPQKAIRIRPNLLSTIDIPEEGAETIDEENYFYGKNVCFTGAFSFGIRKDLLQAIADIGGIPTNSVSSKTDVLVVGQQDYRVVGDSGISKKQKKAMEFIDKGKDIEIMSENEFLYNFGPSLNLPNKTNYW